MMKLLVLFCLINSVFSSEEIAPRIIIVGAGASGIAAASKLLQNGFHNITILEAENRLGGRVYSIKIGEYLADIGGEWVTGEKGNVVYELAQPLGLVEKYSENNEWNSTTRLFGSSGNEVPQNIAIELVKYFENITDSMDNSITLKTGSLGEYVEIKLNNYFKIHPEITVDLHQPLMNLLNLLQMVHDAGKSWHEISAKGSIDYVECEGDQAINWKERTYDTILDILMKKYPNPEEELPVKNITKLNTKVIDIKYDETPVKVITADGEEYSADHVIVTPSLGVLQKNINTLFNPQLPEKKLNTIKNILFGGVAKILLYYENPWWLEDPTYFRPIYWTQEDKKQLENDPLRKWMLSVSVGMRIEHKPKLFLLWVTGNYIKEMELTPEELFQEQVKEIIKKFYGKTYNLTDPTEIKRSLWNTNENFLGTYRSAGIHEDNIDISTENYAEPIIQNNKPVLQFAGEGTSVHYGMVNGAIESGWREADRLIHYYSKKN